MLKEMKDFLPPGMSPEVPYESRYFSVKISPDGQILETNVERIISVDSETVETYVSKAQADRRDHGAEDRRGKKDGGKIAVPEGAGHSIAPNPKSRWARRAKTQATAHWNTTTKTAQFLPSSRLIEEIDATQGV